MELIKVTENDQHLQVVSARDLYEGLQVARRFSLWVKDNFDDFVEDTDFTSVRKSTVVNNGAKRKLQDYALTIEMAKELSMMSHTELGKQYRRYFIDLERKWNDPAEIVKRGYAILQDENAQLRIANNQMKPKALFADSVSTSNTTILIGDLAKIIKQNGVEKMGAKRLFEWMREHHYLISRNGADYNSPTQRSMELGLFEVKETAIQHADGHTTINKTPKVTGKGQQYFINKFLGKQSA